MAQPGGVLTRAGHTEAGCDLARLAGLEPAAVIVEILNEDGTMARRPQLEAFAREHGLKIGTIADLIRYRLEKERSVERIAERDVQTEFGPFRLYCYEDHVNRTVHLALVRGRIDAASAPLVRVHLQDTLRDVVGVHEVERTAGRCARAMQRIAREGAGVVVLLRPHESAARPRRGGALGRAAGRRRASGARRAGAAHLRHRRADPARPRRHAHARAVSAPKQMHGLSAFGLEVVEYVDDSDLERTPAWTTSGPSKAT